MQSAIAPAGDWRPALLLAIGLLALAGTPAWAQWPTVNSRTETWGGSGLQPDRDAFERAQAEQWQREQSWREQQGQRREAWRQQRELTREQQQRQRQSEESLGQRALREQAQNRREQGRMGQPTLPQRP